MVPDEAGLATYVAVACSIFAGSWLIWRGLLNWRLGRAPILVIDRNGILDRRISDASIPWSAIAKVDVTWAYNGASPEPPDIRVLLLNLNPDFAQRLPDKGFARYSRMLDKLVGITGVRIAMLGVKAKPYQVAQALDRYFPRWRQDSITQ